MNVLALAIQPCAMPFLSRVGHEDLVKVAARSRYAKQVFPIESIENLEQKMPQSRGPACLLRERVGLSWSEAVAYRLGLIACR